MPTVCGSDRLGRMSRRLVQLLVLGWWAAWVLVIVPAHTRGVISLRGACAACEGGGKGVPFFFGTVKACCAGKAEGEKTEKKGSGGVVGGLCDLPDCGDDVACGVGEAGAGLPGVDGDFAGGGAEWGGALCGAGVTDGDGAAGFQFRFLIFEFRFELDVRF